MRRPTRRRLILGLVLVLALLLPAGAIPASAAPGVTFSPAALDFGDVQVGVQGYVSTKVTNSGDSPLVFGGFGSTDTSPDRNQLAFDIAGDYNNECPFTFRTIQPLAPGQSCVMRFQFFPHSPGRVQATRSLYDSNFGQPIGALTFVGNAVVVAGKPAFGWDTRGVSFPLRGLGMPSAARKITLTNYGDTPLAILGMALQVDQYSDARDFTFTETCGGTLAPKASCVVSAIFKPQEATRPLQRDNYGFDRDYRYATLQVSHTATAATHYFGLNSEATATANCFPGATDLCIHPWFLAQWRARGDLAINGYPISDIRFERLEDGRSYQVQYFERVRMEWHPEVSDPQFKVLLGQFGRRIRPADPAIAELPGALYFKETGHNVTRGEFATFWQGNGALAQFGFPISEEIEEKLEDGKTYRVQYFERARFEWHQDNPEPFKVQLGQFGRKVCGTGCR